MSKLLVNTELCKAENLVYGDIFIYNNEINTVLDYAHYLNGTIGIVVHKATKQYTCPHGTNDYWVYIPKLCDVVCLIKDVS